MHSLSQALKHPTQEVKLREIINNIAEFRELSESAFKPLNGKQPS